MTLIDPPFPQLLFRPVYDFKERPICTRFFFFFIFSVFSKNPPEICAEEEPEQLPPEKQLEDEPSKVKIADHPEEDDEEKKQHINGTEEEEESVKTSGGSSSSAGGHHMTRQISNLFLHRSRIFYVQNLQSLESSHMRQHHSMG